MRSSPRLKSWVPAPKYVMELAEINVTAAKKKQFQTKDINTVEDLLHYFPRRYNDFSRLTGILPPDQISVFQAKVQYVQSKMGGKMPYILAKCQDLATRRDVYVRWFNCSWMMGRLRSFEGEVVTIIGKVEGFEGSNSLNVNQPQVFDIVNCLKIYPVYSAIKGMSQDYLTAKIADALQTDAVNEETLPDDILAKAKQISTKNEIAYLHNPKTMQEVELGQRRVLFDDLLYFAIHSTLNEKNVSAGSQYNIKTLNLMNKIEDNLPFHLTMDQRAAVDHMVDKAVHGVRINALLVGDVSSGKTITTTLVAAGMIGSGYQVAMMAPTQVLAKQHYETLMEYFEPYGVKIAYLQSGMKKKERSQILAQIASGEAQFVVGTHACIASDVVYKKLALTIVDEEHKFGVKQRAAIVEKASEGVHSITMSATPIPRSLAQVLYGDAIQMETIRTMPSGRKPVITGINRDEQKLMNFLRKEVKRGHQAYVVCPLIDPSDKVEGVASVEEVSDKFRKELGPDGVRIATLTGRDDTEYVEDTISKFKGGEYDVLISTTVIEVGVNVPNATMMIITNAERFGLSSLHQLRGRVGRSHLQSYCVLLSDVMEGRGLDRLNAMCQTNNGFEIAEIDLKLRGAGDFLGTQQSGVNKYVQLMLNNPEEYKECKVYASELIDRGPDCCAMMQKITEERIV